MLLNQAIRRALPMGSMFVATLSVKGIVRRATVERALNAVIRRHTSLHTIYLPSDRYSHFERMLQLSCFARTGLFVPGLCVQKIVSPRWLTVQEFELQCIDDVKTALFKELTEPLNLNTAPPMRALLIRVGSDHMLALVMSHLAMDAWSMRLFTCELKAFYNAEVSGTDARVPPIRQQYQDFCVWQHRMCRGGHFRGHEEFWRQRWNTLKDASLRHSDLPFAIRHGEGMKPVDLCIAIKDSAAIRRSLAALKVTPYTFFRTAMTIVLHHCTGKRRIALWANFANRRQDLFASMIGWCANTHLVAVDVTPEQSCAELLHRVSTAVWDAQAHEALPLPRLWQYLGAVLERYDTRINFDLLQGQAFGSSSALMAPLSISGLRPGDVDIRLHETTETFRLIATYNSLRYTADGVDSILSSMQRIAAAIATAPQMKVSDCARLVFE